MILDWTTLLLLMSAATPILLAALGEAVVERAGVLNLGVEGMMITGALAGFALAHATGSPALGFLGGALAGAALLLVSDVAGRLVARPGELDVGIVTAFVGAPFFIWIVRRQRLREL